MHPPDTSFPALAVVFEDELPELNFTCPGGNCNFLPSVSHRFFGVGPSGGKVGGFTFLVLASGATPHAFVKFQVAAPRMHIQTATQDDPTRFKEICHFAELAFFFVGNIAVLRLQISMVCAR